MANNRKLTFKYWQSLSEDSRWRVLTFIFPIQKGLVDLMLNDTPQRNDPWWNIVFARVKIPADNRHYKTVIHNVYLP